MKFDSTKESRKDESNKKVTVIFEDPEEDNPKHTDTKEEIKDDYEDSSFDPFKEELKNAPPPLKLDNNQSSLEFKPMSTKEIGMAPGLKKKISKEPSSRKRRGSMRKNLLANPFVSDDLGLGDTKFLMNNKLNRNKSAMPQRNLEFEETSSEYSDPEVKRLKRRAVICCKYTVECTLILGILAASAIDFNILSLMYFLGGLMMLLERINLSIKSKNVGQEAIINAFMLSVPVLLLYKISS